MQVDVTVPEGIAPGDEFLVSLDDGFQFVGGTVNADHLSSLFPGDDGAYVDLMLVHFPASWDQKAAGKALRQDQC